VVIEVGGWDKLREGLGIKACIALGYNEGYMLGYIACPGGIVL